MLVPPLLPIVAFLGSVGAEQWPYNRHVVSGPYHSHRVQRGTPEFASGEPPNLFLDWLRQAVTNNTALKIPFLNDTIPDEINSFEALWDQIEWPASPINETRPGGTLMLPIPSPQREAEQLFGHLGYPLAPKCTNDRTNWYFRTMDGSCNWLETGHSDYGQLGTKRARDYEQYTYADGISKPREGPNPREVSNAFFKRKQRLYYEHTPVLLALIEFIMHDVTYSEDSTSEFIDVPVPADEPIFPQNTTFRVWRTTAVPGTGTSKSNPRENANQASTWIDVSSLYGSDTYTARALRSFKKGKLLSSTGKVDKREYLPVNTMGLPMRTRPGVDPRALFAGGDPRTNEDWVMLALHTLLLREHNRLCDILAKQHPEYDDERIYQTIRLALSAKFALIANSYQMAYWTDKMPWPRNDGFPLYRQMYGENALEINPVHLYPWPLVTKGGKPMVASAEMAIVYRFHEFIIPSFPIKDAQNKTVRTQDLFASAFDSRGFVDTGVESILRGIVSTDIPNFKSGVDEEFRSAGKYRGSPFDIVTWSIVHEREQVSTLLPTFNQYFRAYNSYDPAVIVPVRERFEDFSSDPEAVADLKRLYATPDDVDLVVGCQLEETMFPGTTVPSSALIISLFSLFGLGNSDRFSVGYAIMRCVLENKPWDCTPSNAMEELLWDPQPKEGFPNARWFNTFWLTELDFQAHGTNLLWRLVTENTDIRCLQQNPLFPFDHVTNPVMCTLPSTPFDYFGTAFTGVEVLETLVKSNAALVGTTIAGLFALIAYLVYKHEHPSGVPPALNGLPVLGEALKFQKDPKALLFYGMKKFSNKVFGIKLANLTQFIVKDPKDMGLIVNDAQYEVKFSLHEFFRSINCDLVLHTDNFESDLHADLIRNNLNDPTTLKSFAVTIEAAARDFITLNPLVAAHEESKHYPDLNDYLMRYITYVVSRFVLGPQGFDNPDLLKVFMKFNDDAIQTMGLASLLPTFLRSLAGRTMERDYKAIEKVLMPIIRERRASGASDLCFANFILAVVDDDKRAADLMAIVVWTGLTNLQASLAGVFFDITNEPDLQTLLVKSLTDATTDNLSIDRTEPWKVLRSAAFESLRLSTPVTGPARAVLEDVELPSQPGVHLPKGQAVAFTAYEVHRQPSVWGNDAAQYRADRFLTSDPDVGSSSYLTWGPRTPHLCPGWKFAFQVIQIMVKTLLDYDFKQDRVLSEDEKWKYSSGSAIRNPIGMTVRRR